MLNVEELKKQIQTSVAGPLSEAIQQAMKEKYPIQSKQGDQEAEMFAYTFGSIFNENFATGLAYAIDYYIKNAEIYGEIVSAGVPPTAVISSRPIPDVNGEVFNTLGIR